MKLTLPTVFQQRAVESSKQPTFLSQGKQVTVQRFHKVKVPKYGTSCFMCSWGERCLWRQAALESQCLLADCLPANKSLAMHSWWRLYREGVWSWRMGVSWQESFVQRELQGWKHSNTRQIGEQREVWWRWIGVGTAVIYRHTVWCYVPPWRMRCHLERLNIILKTTGSRWRIMSLAVTRSVRQFLFWFVFNWDISWYCQSF